MQDPFATYHSEFFAKTTIKGIEVFAQLVGGKFSYVLALDGHYLVRSWQLKNAAEPYNLPVLSLYRAFVAESAEFATWQEQAMIEANAMLRHELARQIERYLQTADEWQTALDRGLTIEVME